MSTQKDEQTELVRHKLTGVPDIVETDRADSGLTTLSFRSVSHPHRHVWIDTDLAGEKTLELEDWTDETKWDNSVAEIVSEDADVLIAVAHAWLTGADLEKCQAIQTRQ